MKCFYQIKNNLKEFVNDSQFVFDYLVSTGNYFNSNSNLKKVFFTDCPSIEYIFTKYKFLTRSMLLFKIEPGSTVAIHKDGINSTSRNISINIGISGCNKNCITSFYDIDDKYIVNSYQQNTRFYSNNAILKKISEYELNSIPTLVDTQIAHGIDNSENSERRISLSWSTSFITLADAEQYFQQQSTS